MGHHFSCTACGQCCYGQLPLTVEDALQFSDLFPLAMVWTPVREVSKDFAKIAELGALIPLQGAKNLATLIVPASYLPPSLPCPALENKLCGIHHYKPARCRSMPFYPYRDEKFQDELLKPKPGWECDFSEQAPLVYEHHQIIEREYFDLEYQALQQQHSQIQAYAAYMLKYTPTLVNHLTKASLKTTAGQVVTSLSSFLTATHSSHKQLIAQRQLPVLERYLAQTAPRKDLVDFHNYYRSSAKEMSYLARSA